MAERRKLQIVVSSDPAVGGHNNDRSTAAEPVRTHFILASTDRQCARRCVTIVADVATRFAPRRLVELVAAQNPLQPSSHFERQSKVVFVLNSLVDPADSALRASARSTIQRRLPLCLMASGLATCERHCTTYVRPI